MTMAKRIKRVFFVAGQRYDVTVTGSKVVAMSADATEHRARRDTVSGVLFNLSVDFPRELRDKIEGEL